MTTLALTESPWRQIKYWLPSNALNFKSNTLKQPVYKFLCKIDTQPKSEMSKNKNQIWRIQLILENIKQGQLFARGNMFLEAQPHKYKLTRHTKQTTSSLSSALVCLTVINGMVLLQADGSQAERTQLRATVSKQSEEKQNHLGINNVSW